MTGFDRWRQRAFEVGLALLLLVVALPLYVAYTLLIAFPREVWKTAVWSIGSRADALPGSASAPARRAAVAALLEQATLLDATIVAALVVNLGDVRASIERLLRGTPSEVHDAVRLVGLQASEAVIQQALAVAPGAVETAPDDSRFLYITDKTWRRAAEALEAAAAAEYLGGAVDEATRDAWMRPWRELVDAHRTPRLAVVAEPDGPALLVGDVLVPTRHWTFVGNGGTWWSLDYVVVSGPNPGRKVTFDGFVDDATGTSDPVWPPPWLRELPSSDPSSTVLAVRGDDGVWRLAPPGWAREDGRPAVYGRRPGELRAKVVAGSWWVLSGEGHVFLNPGPQPACGARYVGQDLKLFVCGDAVCAECDRYLHAKYLPEIS